MPTPIQLLAISGSLRRASFCSAILRSMLGLLGDRAQGTLFPLNDVPPYDGDLDGDMPPGPVQALKDAIAQADGLVICSPEYNYGMSGVLKNAIDWASRPGFKSPLKGKPTLILTASPGVYGGVRAQTQIRDALSATLARPIERPQLAIPGVAQRVIDGKLVDEATIGFVLQGLDDLMAEVRRSRIVAPCSG